MFRNSICDPKDCDHAWALRVLQNSAGTVKTLKNLPRWLVPCPGSLRSVNLQQLSLSGGVSSLPDEALARLQAQAKMRCFVQILPRANKLLFSMPGLSFYRRLPFNTRNIRFLPRFFSALDVSDIEYDAGRLVLEELEVPAVNDLQAPNMSVKKFSAKLRADSGGNGSKLAGLVNVLPRYFPSLEVLELNVRAEEKLDEYLFHDVGVDELSRFVTRVDWMTVLLESTLRNCVPSCKIEVTYSLRLDCVYDSDPETPEYPENATAMYSELPRLDKFPGFAIDQAAIDEYETNDEIDRPPAEKAVCFIKETQVSDVLKLTVLCHICRYESVGYMR